jgi:hypothetical protein
VNEQILTGPETAKWLRVKLRTLDHWRLRGVGPPYVAIGGRRYYRKADIEHFIKSNVHKMSGRRGTAMRVKAGRALNTEGAAPALVAMNKG